jgi:dTDP-4-amino-4,6-dideoxygalactose transaminase
LSGKRPGEYGDIAAFSFYPGKNLGAFGDAGAIVMNNKDYYEKAKMLVNHGRQPSAKYEHELLGGDNKRIDTLQAAVLRIKLRYLDKWTKMRRSKVEYYYKLLENNKNVVLPQIRENTNPVWHLFVIKVKNRDSVIAHLKEKGVSTGIHYPIALHQQPAYSYMKYKEGDFPVAEKDVLEILSLPLWPEIQEEDIEYICSIL